MNIKYYTIIIKHSIIRNNLSIMGIVLYKNYGNSKKLIKS